MSLISYTVRRNVKAERDGRPVLIAMAFIKHENGFQQTLAIPEDEIRFMGEDIIDLRVKIAAEG